MEMNSCTLWLSYVGDGAPSNGAGAQCGIGWTKEQASENAGHWNNQAPWERFQRVNLSDFDSPLAVPYDQASLVQGLYSFLQEHPSPTETQREALRLFKAGRLASGWMLLNPPPGASK